MSGISQQAQDWLRLPGAESRSGCLYGWGIHETSGSAFVQGVVTLACGRGVHWTHACARRPDNCIRRIVREFLEIISNAGLRI